ncbi:MAG TPA: amino acid adenylation domain-containing protein, partial [Chitinophaga sp.]|uniref:non-ribosomal peptide synthetase n=1 Tax=Chitinophaga sp. TaxID=1869181 RepID=UPI002C73D61E
MINLNVINVDELLEKASRSGITVLLENGKLVMEADEDRDIDETIIEEIKEYKRIIIDHLRNKKVTDSLTATIAPVKRDGEAIPLSFSQERLWFIDKLEGSVHYHIPTVLKFRGVLDSTALEQAFREVVNRHEVLRTVMREEDGQAWQHFLEKDSWHLSAIDESAGREEAIHTLLHAPFDLSQDHMLRAALLNDGPSAYLLVMVMHHIASDGWSGNVLVRELVELYSAYATQRLPDLQPLPVQYADYAVWQRSYMSGEVLHKLERYWEQQLAGVEPLNLPLDYPRPAVQSTRGAMHHMVIDAGLTADLHRFSQEQNATLFMTLLSVYKVLLYRYSGQEVICVGTPIAGRRRRETEDLIGFFANTLALRSDLSNDQPFTALLQQVKDTLLGGYDHQDIPFEKVVDVAARDRDRSRHPLFQVMFVLQNIPEMTAATLGDTTISMVAPENKTAKFELTFTITEEKKRLQLDIEYCTDLFNAATIARMAAHYEQLLKSVVAAPSQLTGSLPMITPAEEKQLLQDFPGVRVNYPQHTTILDLIEKQVAERPDAIAVTYENESLTYGELDRKATQLGHYLRSHGVQEETLVPLCIDRGTDMIVGILGIMKAGGAYVPMDPAYPEDRIRYMLEDTKATVVVSNSRCSAVCNYSAARMIELDTDQEIIRQQPVINPDIQRSPQHVAYVIYTSGSTGRPKGVLIEHYNVVRLFETDIMLYDFNESDVWTMFHSFCFDFSVWEMYGALFYGGRLVVVPKQVTIDSSLFGQLLLEEQVTVLNQTPSSFYVLQDYMVSHADAVPVRYVIFGGEALNPVRIKAWKQHYPACRLINMYGITETTVHVTFQEMLPVHLEHPASVIGHTIPTLYAYILNNNRTPVPVGVSGELYISGAGLARGYLNLPALTAERFIPSPFIAGERLYKTGDLARWLPDGNLEYLGRIDDQVKIRGFRIELGEIESVLQKSNLVQSCVIIAKTDKTGNKQLVGYVVPKAEFNKEALQSWLREHLPEYMVPAAWVPLEKIPLTVNGKVDRKALPDPEDVIVNTTAYVAPRNETEQQLAAIWEELLGIQQAGIYDNFFERGGDSIRVIKVVSRVKQAFGRNLKVFDVYQSATIADLAALLEKAAVSGNTEDNLHAAIGAEIAGIREEVMPQLENAALIEDVYPMSDIEQGMVYSSVLNPDEALYHGQFVYNIPAAFSAEIVREAFAAIVSRHSILRTAFRLNTAGHDLQVVYRSVDVKVGSFDLTMMTSSEVEETIGAFLEQERSKPFVFHEAPLWRATVFELKQHNIYVFQFHHAILDGWSVASLNTELYQLCTEIHAGRPLPVVPPLKSSYRDYIIESIATKRNTATHAFWKQELAAYKRLDIFTEETCQERFSRRYADTFLYKLREKAGRENISLKAIFFGAYLYSLSALTYENDVTIGLVTNSRPLSEDGDRLIGCFLNTVPFRFTMVNSSTWQSYFEEIERKLLRLKEVDRTSLLTIAEITREQGNAGNPFFDALFNFVNFHVYGKLGESGAGENEEDNIALSGHELTNTFLDCTVNLTGGVFAVSYSLRKKLRSEKTLEQLEEYFSNALLFYLEQPDRKISDCPVLPAAEHYPLLRTFAGESVHYPEDKTVLDLFEEKAVLAPEATALVCDNERWSYKTLDEQSNRLAHYLKASGTVPEDLIVVCIGRRPEMLVAMLGILKAGAAYVPVDPGYPQDRIQYILNDCKCRQVIALTSTADFFAENDMNVICLDAPSDVLLQHPVHAVNDRPAVTQLAYIIYTSGSTGRPKGVMIEHRNLVNLVHWHIDSHEVLPESRATAMASVGFDAFGWEVWPYLCAGSSLWLLDDQIKTAPQRLAAFYANEQITHSFIATGLVEDVLDALRHRTTDLQYLLTGGDRLQRVDTTGLSFVLSNNYGPTENTVVTTSYFLGEEADETLPPIGRAVSNTNTYVLNANLDLAPVGVPGELCVGGAQLARGYLNLPELTAEKFVPHPFIKGARLYRTGDLVRRRGDGNIEFIDRLDDQVKIRGYRIELGEIENILKQAPGIRQCAVTARHDNRGIKYLAGYVVTEHDFDKAATEAWLKQQLPAYMIPAAWVVLEELPLTVNGKVDRKALPDADPAALKTTAYTAPRNETEATLAAIWQQLLRIERIGIYDNFFELGGHSLLALRLLAAIRKELTAELEMKALFRYPTIAALSESGELKGGHVLLPAITAGTRPLQLPLSFSQERLWFIDRLEGTLHYHIPLVLRMKGPLNETALHHALQTIVERHEVLRTVYRQEEETVCQVIRDAAQWTFTALDTATDLKTAVASFIATPFDLSADYMLRAAVSTVSTEEHLLVICLHHIAADGWSAEVIVREFTSLYSAYLHNTPVALPPLPVQYADFAIWQRNYVNDGVLQQQQSYWMKQLAGVETLNLPADYARPAIQSIRGAMFHTTID